MTVTLLARGLAAPDGGAQWYQDSWLATVELHLTYLLALAGNKSITLVPTDTLKYRFDFFQLLQSYNYPRAYHYPIMRMNGLKASTDYDGTLKSIIVPTATDLNRLMNTHQAMTQKTSKIA